MPAKEPNLRRAARQQLETLSLLGVDFVPVRDVPVRDIEAGVDPDSPAPVAARPERASAAPAPAPANPPSRSFSPGGSPFNVGQPVEPELPRARKQEALDALRAEHDESCPHCTTATGHTRLVFGEGNPDARLMFVGEAPGETEDQLGRPFVGRAGQKLDEIIRAMKLRREDVYIANVLKARPPENRTPLQYEVDRCGPYLARQIRIIRPSAIVALGGPSAKLLLGVETGITRLRGVWAAYRDEDLTIPVMPTFHPAYLLRNYTPETRRQVWSDMQAVMERLTAETR